MKSTRETPLQALLYPADHAAGLAISEHTLRFFDLKTGMRATVPVAPGTLADGVVRERAHLDEALRELHAKVAHNNERVDVVAVVPPHTVLVEGFRLASDGSDVQVETNLRVIAPFPLEGARYDVQRVADAIHTAAFARREALDPFIEALQAADFFPVAIEFPALGMSRLLPAREPSLLVRVDDEGVSMSVHTNRTLVFANFISWREAREEFGADHPVHPVVEREVRRVLTLHPERLGGAIRRVWVSAKQESFTALSAMIRQTFSLSVERFVAPHFANEDSSWYAVGAAALRGVMPREEDHDISLAPEGTEALARERRNAQSLLHWRNAIIVSLGLLLLGFLVVDSLFFQREVMLQRELAEGEQRPDIRHLLELQAHAHTFNRLVTLSAGVDSETVAWSAFLDDLATYAGSEVSFERVRINADDLQGGIVGRAEGEVDAVAFKERLQKDVRIIDVILPLAEITPSGDGVQFRLEFLVESFE